MNATMRGLVILGGMIAVMAVCGFITFVVLPGAGMGVALPVIMVPGEPYDPALRAAGAPFYWTNTLTGTVIPTVAVLIFTFLVVRKSNGWKKLVPGRLQSIAELAGGFMYGFAKQMAGHNARTIFPLVATIFVFLLAANWMKLLPGVESVGVMHCAEEGFSGYAATTGLGGYRLYADQPLFAGHSATHESYEACNSFFHHGDVHPPAAEEVSATADAIRDEEATLRTSLEGTDATDAEIDAQVEALRLELTQSIYPNATLALNEKQMRDGAYPYIFVVTPYVRGAATDLNFTIGLALVAVVAVQIFGIKALGLSYFQKFINLQALGNVTKNPIGAVNFVVGLFEIISELGKIVSLAFRLFGNMFAGGIVVIVMSFLVALFLPAVFLGLEIIITTVQALVFAVLTLVFSAQAMTAHHGDDDHGHEAEHGEQHAH